ncbi:MAG: S41 family peptidase [Vulcanimicrobiaceae bacterium]
MTGTFRALVGALIVVAIAAVGAVYLRDRASVVALSESNVSMTNFQENRGVLTASGGDGSSLIELAAQKLKNRFYKPIAAQTPITGEEQWIEAYLRGKNIAKPVLPHEIASGNASQDATQLADVLRYADAHYAQKIGPQGRSEIEEAALRGIMGSVKDPYTVYLSPKEIQSLTESLSGGNFGGIGVYIEQLKNLQVVVMPIEGMPAARAGMKPGEIVDSVDGKSVHGLSLDRVEQMIRGEQGTIVHLTTHAFVVPAPKATPGPEHSYAIVREIIHVPTVHAKMEGNIDYIRLSDFGQTSADEIRKALLNGKAKGAKGYILDLRDNGGGLLEAAVRISSYFIPQGAIVSTIKRDGSKTTQEADGDAIGGLSPLVILVNGYTASASEITAGALQDYHLATLIGTKTFGKGVVQTIYDMPNDGALKITTARYVTPLGRDIQHKGIMPDIVVAQDPDPMLIGTPGDKQLAFAMARLRKLIR